MSDAEHQPHGDDVGANAAATTPGADPPDELFAPGREIRAKIIDFSGAAPHVDEYIYHSRLTKRFTDEINALCVADGVPELFRNWDDVDLRGLRTSRDGNRRIRFGRTLLSLCTLTPR